MRQSVGERGAVIFKLALKPVSCYCSPVLLISFSSCMQQLILRSLNILLSCALPGTSLLYASLFLCCSNLKHLNMTSILFPIHRQSFLMHLQNEVQSLVTSQFLLLAMIHVLSYSIICINYGQLKVCQEKTSLQISILYSCTEKKKFFSLYILLDLLIFNINLIYLIY